MESAVVLRGYGGPEVLQLNAIDVGHPGEGELRIRQSHIGVNFHDVYVRSGLYKTLPLPGIPGIEGVGVVDAVGPGVAAFAKGDRVAYVTGTYGCYASARRLPAGLAVKLPDGISDELAAATLLKGLTVDMLVNRVHRIQAGDWVLVHAAAGAVSQMLVQWANRLGARVIGTVGSSEKVPRAKAAGCAHVILYREDDVAGQVREITAGRGVDVVYDGVGKDTMTASINALALCGHVVNFGQASGPVDPIALSTLATRSTTLSRPMIFHYVAAPQALDAMCRSVFSALSDGWLRAGTPTAFALKDAADAHRLLESRNAQGPVLLTV